MIKKIIRYELSSRLRQPLFIIYFLLMAIQAVWFIQGSYEVYVNDATQMNGSTLFYRSFAGSSIIMTILIALITGSVLWKDIQYKSAGIIYATSINEKTFFAGRFLSAYSINLILGFGMFLGLLLVPYSGIGTPEKFGSAPILQMLFGFSVLTASNLFIYTALSISFLVLTRRNAASYLSIFFITLLFFVCETLRPESSNLVLLQLLDPSAFVYTTITIDTIPLSERNVAFLPLTQLFFLNRIIWLGFSMLMLALAYRSFTFKRFISSGKDFRKAKRIEEKAISNIGMKPGIQIPRVQLNYRFVDFISKLLRLAFLEVKNVVRAPGFKILIVVLSIVFFVFNVLWNSSFFIGPSYPLTSTMTLTRIAMGTWVSLILMIWTGELLFKDRVVGFWQVNDAFPVPVWVNVFSKFLAMSVITLVISCMFIFFGVVAQVLKGGTGEIDMAFYVSELLGYNWGWLNYLQMLALVCLITGLTASRFATHLLSIGIYFFNLVSFDLEIIEDLRFIYMLVPGVDDYSEMNGYGIWATSIPWFFLLWTSLAIVFLALAVYFWKRGASHQFKTKLSFQGRQLNWVGKGVVGFSLLGFFYLQFFILENVHAKGNFESKLQKQEKEALYEKRYKRLEDYPQPRITKVDLQLDFYPEDRAAEFRAEFQVHSSYKGSMDTLYLNFPDFTHYQKFLWEGDEVKPSWVDADLNFMALPVKMLPDSSGTLVLEGARVHTGFTQDKHTQQPELTYNGSFLRAQDLLPVIGYSDELELQENRYRKDWGLEKLGSRMADVTDSTALTEDAYSPDATWLTGTIALTTSKDQVAIGPGELKDSGTTGTRSYAHYSIENPSPFEWYFGSASYQDVAAQINEVNVRIYHKPKHTYNIPFFKKSVVSALDFVQTELGEYPYAELKIMEIPFYQDPHYSFPNTIAISEKEGWFADTTSFDNKVYLSFTLASNIVKHWVMQNVPTANVQGADMLRKALPEALAVQVIRKEYGEKGVDWLITKKQGLYSRERGTEPNTEPPLVAADGIAYLEENKGTIELYRFSELLGFESFNTSVKNWSRGLDTNATFADLYQDLLESEILKQVPLGDMDRLKDAFEKVEP